MTIPDLLGLGGVCMMLAAYAAAQLGRLEPRRPPALLLNLAGAALVMLSLAFRFNLPAFLMELAWALVALFGLVRLVLQAARRKAQGGN